MGGDNQVGAHHWYLQSWDFFFLYVLNFTFIYTEF